MAIWSPWNEKLTLISFKSSNSAAAATPSLPPSLSGVLGLEDDQVGPALLVALLEDGHGVLAEAAAGEVEPVQPGDELRVGLTEGRQEDPGGLVRQVTEAEVQPHQGGEHLGQLLGDGLVDGVLAVLVDQVDEPGLLVLPESVGKSSPAQGGDVVVTAQVQHADITQTYGQSQVRSGQYTIKSHLSNT